MFVASKRPANDIFPRPRRTRIIIPDINQTGRRPSWDHEDIRGRNGANGYWTGQIIALFTRICFSTL
jgi:hypothetical protein